MATLFYGAYFVGYVISVFLTSGWGYAYERNGYLSGAKNDPRDDAGIVVAFSVAFNVIWPILLPATFAITGFARYGWRAPWDFRQDV